MQMTRNISDLFIEGIKYVEQRGSLYGELVGEEEEILSRSVVSSRWQSFACGRTCARRALRELGITDAEILRGERGEPLWPLGISGAITHCRAFCAAAVARSSNVAGIGIDAEPNEPLPQGVLPFISNQLESRRLRELPCCSTNWDKLLFSIKESVYKAWYPITHQWLSWEQVHVEINPDNCIFSADLEVSIQECNQAFPRVLKGRYFTDSSLIVSAVWVLA
jgi:4'-phosphopantetheinyl transferase EntD